MTLTTNDYYEIVKGGGVHPHYLTEKSITI